MRIVKHYYRRRKARLVTPCNGGGDQFLVLVLPYLCLVALKCCVALQTTMMLVINGSTDAQKCSEATQTFWGVRALSAVAHTAGFRMNAHRCTSKQALRSSIRRTIEPAMTSMNGISFIHPMSSTHSR